MKLVMREPTRQELTSLRSLRTEVDRLFREVVGHWLGPGSGWTSRPGDEGGFVPKVNLREEGNQYVVEALLPGLSEEDVEIAVNERSVTLRGERKQETSQVEWNYHYRETFFGSFQRFIPLPGEVATDRVKAELKEGILTIVLPKSEPSKRTSVSVRIE